MSAELLAAGPLELSLLPDMPTREDMEALEDRILALPDFKTKDDFPTANLFHGGMYAKTIEIPEGDLLTGHVHRTDHLNFLLSGIIQVWTEDGMQVLHAPALVPGRAGRKRVGIALTPVLWATVAVTAAATPEDADAELLEPVRATIVAAIAEAKKCPQSS